ncbi:FlgT C-terminal domain-containing protein [Clostridium cagae]|uniref:FlgT C-terminal domain-containing protein n=1 Tax=Clostridium cagae TaxID=2080751 RepID=UPI003F75B231
MEIYKVIKIISDSEILINAGSEHKIKTGDNFDIFTTGEEIFDPDTNESLGTLDTVKATVEVVIVYPKMCLCQKIIRKAEGLVGFALDLKKEVIYKERLKVDATEISGGLSDDLIIHLNDLVRRNLG